MEFQDFKFPDIRQTVLRKNLVLTNWVGFHENTEFKARAALYHMERLNIVYKQYIEEQPLPDAQTVFNLYHPLKQVVFFEFHAVIANLYSCFDSLLQEINCAYRLNLTQTAEKGKKYVTFKEVKKRLNSQYEGSPIINLLNKLEEQGTAENEWFTFLKRMRNAAVHSDMYTNSEEVRDIVSTMKKFEAELSITPDEFKKTILKREISIRLGNGSYFMLHLLLFLKKKMLSYVGSMHDAINNDRKLDFYG